MTFKVPRRELHEDTKPCALDDPLLVEDYSQLTSRQKLRGSISKVKIGTASLGETAMSAIGDRLSRRAFPHWASAWWIPVFLSIGWGPLLLSELLAPPLRDGENVGFAMAWGLTVSLACTALVGVSLLIQLFRLVGLLLDRQK